MSTIPRARRMAMIAPKQVQAGQSVAADTPAACSSASPPGALLEPAPRLGLADHHVQIRDREGLVYGWRNELPEHISGPADDAVFPLSVLARGCGGGRSANSDVDGSEDGQEALSPPRTGKGRCRRRGASDGACQKGGPRQHRRIAMTRRATYGEGERRRRSTGRDPY